uniref:Uncharacterized protein n=1 Tax=Ignisphaera aggregans TaxID=334771 RepID=A0A7J3QGY7_9CREN
MFNRLLSFTGLSETLAIFILIGFAIVFAISFSFYFKSIYIQQNELAVLLRSIDYEKLNYVVRMLYRDDRYVTFLFRRLDGVAKPFVIFIDDGSSYLRCSSIVSVNGGYKSVLQPIDLSEINVASSSGVYSYKYYAKTMNYPLNDNVELCTIYPTSNNVIATIQFDRPIRQGYSKTVFSSVDRDWRLFGTIIFKVSYLINPATPHITVNGQPYRLRVGDIVRIDIDTKTSQLILSQEGQIIWIESLKTSQSTIAINNLLIATNADIEMAPDIVAVDASSIDISLSIEISSTKAGFTRLTYGDEDIVNGNSNEYIKVVGWTFDASQPLSIELTSQNLNAEGIAYAIYMGYSYKPQLLRIHIATILNNIIYLLDTYELNLD